MFILWCCCGCVVLLIRIECGWVFFLGWLGVCFCCTCTFGCGLCYCWPVVSARESGVLVACCVVGVGCVACDTCYLVWR